jgi:hypothetical protein
MGTQLCYLLCPKWWTTVLGSCNNRVQKMYCKYRYINIVFSLSESFTIWKLSSNLKNIFKLLIFIVKDLQKEFGRNSQAEISPPKWLKILRKFNHLVKHAKNLRNLMLIFCRLKDYMDPQQFNVNILYAQGLHGPITI